MVDDSGFETGTPPAGRRGAKRSSLSPDIDHRSSRFVSANEQTIHYLDWGGAGRPILLLHGLRDQAHEWDTIAPLLRPFGRVIALDQRGHGASSHPPTGYAPEDFAADLAAFCAALALPASVVIGHSLGGRTAYLYAADHPEQVIALAVIDIGADAAPATIPGAIAALQAGYGPFQTHDEATHTLLGGNRQPNASMRRYLEYNLHRDADGRLAWRYSLDAAIAATRLSRARAYWDVVRRLRVLTLLVRGARSDVLPPAEAAQFCATVPDHRCTLVEIPGAGHLVPQARPYELAAILQDWLAPLLR
ncbi:MAG: alpha/beta fold hydrolase [Thermomicrobiales bacterium]